MSITDKLWALCGAKGPTATAQLIGVSVHRLLELVSGDADFLPAEVLSVERCCPGEGSSSREAESPLSRSELLGLFRDRVWSRPSVVDPKDCVDWAAMAFGFFLALGVEVEEARELAQVAVEPETYGD